jgi:hypothetical protein
MPKGTSRFVPEPHDQKTMSVAVFALFVPLFAA